MSEENVKPEEKDTSQTTHTEATPATEQPAAAENRDKAARAEGEKVSPATESPAAGAAQPASAASEDEAAKAKAREEARAARAAARAAKAAESGGGGEEKPKEPSPNQPKLDRLVEIVREALGEGVIQEAYINERDRHLPVIVVDKARWTETARLLKEHSELKLDYLRNVTGVDYETHMEVDYFLTNLSDKQGYCVKVRMDREEAEMPSAATVWPTANWPEREIYDLLGVTFTGHPDLRRIMMPDDWVGHPLRKDYEPIDPEV